MSEVSKASLYVITKGAPGAISKASIYVVGIPMTGTARPKKDINVNKHEVDVQDAVFSSPVVEGLTTTQVNSTIRTYRLVIPAAAYGGVPAKWLKLALWSGAGIANFTEMFLGYRDGSSIVDMKRPVPVSVEGTPNFSIPSGTEVTTDPIEIKLTGTEDLILSYRTAGSFYFRHKPTSTLFDVTRYNEDAMSYASLENVSDKTWTDFSTYKAVLLNSITVGN
jgi:hypothetical protein